ncbi:pilus assembly protein TadG-related protein [Sphingopyxis sp.]|uniref:TadE/TadG family type IV pilus assembly protein n=1 Tax=Sphingopyxis sp. TaxID=1908224 RepID=UPI003D0BDA78
MRGTVFTRLRRGIKRLSRDQRGNAMMLTAAAIVPVLGMVGSGIDIGRAYMAQLRLQQACDAGVLAGRRAQAGGTYTNAAKAEANKMFAFNYSAGAYGSTGVTFSSQALNASDVAGSASARLPAQIMKIFGFNDFNLAVSCAAKLEVSNTDIMMVLDVTGSMDTVNSGDSVSRIEALRTAAVDFFDTLTTADMGDGRLRFGVVPYSGTVNVGAILLEENPDWISDVASTPTRVATFVDVWGTGTTTTGSPSGTTYPGNPTSGSSWSAWANFGSGITQANCVIPTQAAGGTATKSGAVRTTQTGQYLDSNGNRVTTYNNEQDWTYTRNAYRWSSNRCQRQTRPHIYTETTPSALTQPPVKQFSYFTYKNFDLPVAPAKSGNAVTLKTGTRGVDKTFTWDGCIIERDTTTFGPTSTAPSNAFDMNIDMVPTADARTQWKMFFPEFAYSRASTAETTSTSTSNVSSFGDQADSGSDIAACPPPAMRLTTMTAADRSTFVNRINALRAQGYTYHDVGMVWGARLLSPTGILAAENATAPNNRPINRHIVFMTDGDPTAPRNNFSFQSEERSTGRIGASSDTDAVNRHTNRFQQICAQARGNNTTIWVVSFGTTLTTNLRNCASPGAAYQANNAAQLNEQFQAIARQISKLRLSQ